MTSLERKAKKRKMRLQYWIAYVIGIGCTGIYIFIMLKFIAPVETEGMTDVQEMWTVIKWILPIIFCPLISLMIGMSAGYKNRDLMSEFGRLYNLKNKHKFRLFYELIVSGKLDEARLMFNQIALRDDTYRVFAHGMLITVMRISGVDKHIQMAEKRMKDILEEK
jgi:hypothetical protein